MDEDGLQQVGVPGRLLRVVVMKRGKKKTLELRGNGSKLRN